MVYGRYNKLILLMGIISWFINQQTSLGGPILWQTTKKKAAAEPFLFLHGRHESTRKTRQNHAGYPLVMSNLQCEAPGHDSVQLVQKTPITMVYGCLWYANNYSYWGLCAPTNITGGPHIVAIEHVPFIVDLPIQNGSKWWFSSSQTVSLPEGISQTFRPSSQLGFVKASFDCWFSNCVSQQPSGAVGHPKNPMVNNFCNNNSQMFSAWHYDMMTWWPLLA